MCRSSLGINALHAYTQLLAAIFICRLRVLIYVFCPFSREKLTQTQKCIEYGKYSDSQIDKPQAGCPKRAELPDVNI